MNGLNSIAELDGAFDRASASPALIFLHDSRSGLIAGALEREPGVARQP